MNKMFNAYIYSTKACGIIFIGSMEECVEYIKNHMDEQNKGEIYMSTKGCEEVEDED